MKAVFKVAGMRNTKDIGRIKDAIANNEGIVACQIIANSGQIEVIYDDYFINEERLIECIENLGYTVV
ncbi:heavy-metal-associated domain-containing protein [Haloimpatiens sp. FM7315]|uniref:heavy-metal-associated domain-containing protein n=1 Tax=Haloimpatiens sp. FM7315 TaxID=3298609 RepID=UPI0035A35511